MTKYRYNATNLIVETFNERGVKFDVRDRLDSEQVLAGFSVDCGPSVIVRFISRDDDNDVAVRVAGLLTNTPKEKRARVLEACNILNHKIRYVKFVLDRDGDISVEYDFPIHTPDEGVGEMAFEIFVRTMQILDREYNIFMTALYSDDELQTDDEFPTELISRLEELRSKVLARRNETDFWGDIIEIVDPSDVDDDDSFDGGN
ncbi:MAG: YbjN domain-containing protein [Clostridiales bacterium]|nr:YbjN domain-containing protein [Clostridiales bacterium]